MRKKKYKNHTKIHILCVNHEEKTVEEVEMHNFLVSKYQSQDFAQSQDNFVRSHDGETVTLRNSEGSQKKVSGVQGFRGSGVTPFLQLNFFCRGPKKRA